MGERRNSNFDLNGTLGGESRHIYIDASNVAAARKVGYPEWDAYAAVVKAWNTWRPQDVIHPVSDYTLHGALTHSPGDQFKYETARNAGREDKPNNHPDVLDLTIWQAPEGEEADVYLLGAANEDPQGKSIVISQDRYTDRRHIHPWLQADSPRQCRLWAPRVWGVPPAISVDIEPVLWTATLNDMAKARLKKATALEGAEPRFIRGSSFSRQNLIGFAIIGICVIVLVVIMFQA